MNIKEAKQELVNTVRAYTRKREDGSYVIPLERQRPMLLMGPPGIGKTAILAQVAEECGVGLVAYTMTHHTRQSAIGLPLISHENFQGKEYAVTEYTMSEIIASVYRCMEETGLSEGILFLDEINCVSETLAPTMLQFLQKKTFGTHKIPDGWMHRGGGQSAGIQPVGPGAGSGHERPGAHVADRGGLQRMAGICLGARAALLDPGMAEAASGAILFAAHGGRREYFRHSERLGGSLGDDIQL